MSKEFDSGAPGFQQETEGNHGILEAEAIRDNSIFVASWASPQAVNMLLQGGADLLRQV